MLKQKNACESEKPLVTHHLHPWKLSAESLREASLALAKYPKKMLVYMSL